MAITKIQAGALPADVITTAAIDDASITHAKLHTDMDLSSKTVTLPTLSTLNTTGSVGIGTSSPKRHLHLNNPAALTTKIQITNLTTGASTDGDGFQLGISNDGTANIEQRENLDMAFATNNTERMRISSLGTVLVGKTSEGTGTDGIELNRNDVIVATRNNDAPLILNRRTSDGDITVFRKDNAAVGSISSNSAGGVPVLDINTHPSSGIMRMLTSGTERMRIDNSGKVGIGIDTPLQNLAVKVGTDIIVSMWGDNSAGYGAIQSASVDNSTYKILRFDASSYNFIGGNVGIGISPTHLLHVQAGSTGNGDVKIGGGAGLLISHNNSGHTVQTIKSLYHATSASSNLRIVTGFLTVSTGTSDTERLRLKSNGSFEIGYAGAALQQADNQAMTITTPASGGGKGIALKRLDSNSDQQLGEITWSNNTQDGQASIRVKTDGAVNTTDMHFDVNNAGSAVTSALKIDGSQGGKISLVSREMSIQGMELRHGTFGIGNYNRRVEIQLGNYESAHVRIMAQRTNGGSCLVYWEGYINNNNNAGYSTTIASRTSDGSVSYSFSVSGGNYRWDFNAAGSSGDGSFVVQGARGGASINVTTW